MAFRVVPQIGVLPWRLAPHGHHLEVLVISRRSGSGWTLPKGHTEPGRTLREQAAIEAWEEAGIVRVRKSPMPEIGTLEMPRRGERLHIRMFLLQVDHLETQFPEAGQRRRRWVHPPELITLLPRDWHSVIDHALPMIHELVYEGGCDLATVPFAASHAPYAPRPA